MFGKILKNLVATIFLLFMVSCGASLGVESGVEPTEVLYLDGEYGVAITMEKGEILALDMRVPIKSGYTIVGASFDPIVLKLEHFLEYKDGDEPRAQYMFTLLTDGTTDILVKMQPLTGGDSVVYKSITVNICEYELF